MSSSLPSHPSLEWLRKQAELELDRWMAVEDEPITLPATLRGGIRTGVACGRRQQASLEQYSLACG